MSLQFLNTGILKSPFHPLSLQCGKFLLSSTSSLSCTNVAAIFNMLLISAKLCITGPLATMSV